MISLRRTSKKKHFPVESATHGAIKGTKDGKKEELFSVPSPDTIWGSTNGCYKYFPEFFKRTEGCFGIFAIGVKLAMKAMMGNQSAIKCIVGERHYQAILASFNAAEKPVVVNMENAKVFAAAGLDHIFELIAAAEQE